MDEDELGFLRELERQVGRWPLATLRGQTLAAINHRLIALLEVEQRKFRQREQNSDEEAASCQ